MGGASAFSCGAALEAGDCRAISKPPRGPRMDIGSLIVEDNERGTFRVHRSVMTSEEILALERERIFDRCWLYIGHESELQKPGDYRRRDVAGRPLIFIRGKDGIVRVFHNSCTHWGAKVCRLDQGNAETFQCFYHAWTFNNLGQLVGIPDAAAYPRDFDRAALALKTPPKLDNYRGLYFVSFNPGVEPLLDYMAKFKGSDYETETRASALRAGGLGRSLGNGHGVGESAMGGMARPIAHWHPMFGDNAKAEIARVRARIVERFGEERAWRMCDTFRLFLIYPNFVFHDVMAITIRYFEPVAPDAVRITVYALAPNEESKEQLDLRLNNFVSFLGPGGFAHPDDLEAIESCQDSFRSREVEWSDFSRGLRRDPELMDELPIRAFWRQWHAQIMGHQKAARVDDLPLAGNGRALAAK